MKKTPMVTLPGSIPGLLCRYVPVVLLNGDNEDLVERGVITRIEPDPDFPDQRRCWVTFDDGKHGPYVLHYWDGWLELDLEQEEGLAAAKSWAHAYGAVLSGAMNGFSHLPSKSPAYLEALDTRKAVLEHAIETWPFNDFVRKWKDMLEWKRDGGHAHLDEESDEIRQLKEENQEILTGLALELMDERDALPLLEKLGITGWKNGGDNDWVKDADGNALYVARDGRSYRFGVEKYEEGEGDNFLSDVAKSFLDGIRKAEKAYKGVQG